MTSRSLSRFNNGHSVAHINGERGPFGTFYDMFDRMFAQLVNSWAQWPSAQIAGLLIPSIDVTEHDGEISVTADLPGVREEDVDVEISNGALILRARRGLDQGDEGDSRYWHLNERPYGTVMRTIHLPANIDADDAEATFDRGTLRITVPRLEGSGSVLRIPIRAPSEARGSRPMSRGFAAARFSQKKADQGAAESAH